MFGALQLPQEHPLMSSLPRTHCRVSRTTIWLLSVAMLVTTMIPLHYHVHVAPAEWSDHEVGEHRSGLLHQVVDHSDEHHRGDRHTVEASSPATLKAAALALPMAALSIAHVLVVVVPLRVRECRQAAEGFGVQRLLWQNAPPLRAPPTF